MATPRRAARLRELRFVVTASLFTYSFVVTFGQSPRQAPPVVTTRASGGNIH